MQDILSFASHHWMLSIAAIIVLILIILIEYIRGIRGAKRLSPLQATQYINHQNATVVDLRSHDAFVTGHIVGAISVPFAELDNKLKKLDKFKSQPIILVCTAGLESSKAAILLEKKGMNIFILAGGMRGWRDAEMPVIKD